MPTMQEGWMARAHDGRMFVTATGGARSQGPAEGDTLYLYAPDGTRFQITWSPVHGGIKVLVDSVGFEAHLGSRIEVIPQTENAVVLVGKG